MKYLAAALLALLVLLQYRLWLGEGGMREVGRLRAEIATQKEENENLRERNRTLAAEVQDLKKGTVAIEERARTDLGMIGKTETFYQVVTDEKQAAAAKLAQPELARPDLARPDLARPDLAEPASPQPAPERPNE